jgi:hypothetical protein
LSAFRKSIELHESQSVPLPSPLRIASGWEFYLHGDLAEVKRLAELPKASEADVILQGLLLAENGSEFDTHLSFDSDLPPPGVAEVWYRPLGWLLSGRKEEARDLFEQLASTNRSEAVAAGNSPTRSELQRLLDYGAGRITSDQLLTPPEAAAPSNLRRNDAHFLVAMQLLSAGRRRAAAEHFQGCLQAGIVTSPAYQTSRAILKKWEQSPAWPKSIPELETPSEHE